MRVLILGLFVFVSCVQRGGAYTTIFRRLSKVTDGGTLSKRILRPGHICVATDSSQSPEVLNKYSESNGGPQRLYPDMNDFTTWLTEHGGYLLASVSPTREGWQLSSKANITAGSVAASIPKKLCIYADPAKMAVPFLEATARLMESLQPSQWRARLAVALLSERVRPDSFFSPYIRNLPFEFWGMPIFYSAAEQRQLQDDAVVEAARTRSRFLAEFTASVLSPLQRTAQDPFSGHAADADALAWGFAAASSRALRDLPQDGAPTQGRMEVIDTTGVAEDAPAAALPSAESCAEEEDPAPSRQGEIAQAVLVPGIDFAAHSFSPNCAVRDAGDRYVLYATRTIGAGEALTVDYGALSNAELLQDYGFTVDGNPNDQVMLPISSTSLRDAKEVGLQLGNPLFDFRCDLPLQTWQRVWLTCAGIPSIAATVSFEAAVSHAARGDSGRAASPLARVDARLLALLRVLHTPREADLLRLGYDPLLLQRPGSALGAPRESQVVLTLISLLLMALRDSGTELGTDLWLLQKGVSESAGKPGTTESEASDEARPSSSLSRIDKNHGDVSCARILHNLQLLKPRTRLCAPEAVAAQQPATGVLGAGQHKLEKEEDRAGDSLLSSYPESSRSREIRTILSSPRNSVRSLAPTPVAGCGDKDAESVVVVEGLGSMGASLAPNTREAYRYRIRRKRAIADLVLQLTELYELLGGTGVGAGAVEAVLLLESGAPERAGVEGGKPIATEPLSRIDKIRQLLDQGKLLGATDDTLVRARAFAAKWPQNL